MQCIMHVVYVIMCSIIFVTLNYPGSYRLVNNPQWQYPLVRMIDVKYSKVNDYYKKVKH